MTDWTSGYVADIGYTYGYYQELNPARIKLAFLSAGLVCPDIGVACELGFGQGLSANIHAAGTMVQYFGTDFNPSQASFAQEVASASEVGAQLFDQTFEEFCTRNDLPDFDYIGLHGIWSWISNPNREAITSFIRRKLKVGGVLYISYNTQPGWSTFAPMRHLLAEHANSMSAPSAGTVSRIDHALTFADKLLATNPAFVRVNPTVADRVKNIEGQNRNYIAHEFFNRDWLPMYFNEMAKWLESAKLSFACSAHFLEHIDVINLTEQQRSLLSEQQSAVFRETSRDFMVNQQFRRDYWVKGARELTQHDRKEKLCLLSVILTTPRGEVPQVVNGFLGEAKLQSDIYTPLLDAMADHKPKQIGQLETILKANNTQFGQVIQAIVLLAGAGHLSLVQAPPLVAKAKKHTEKLNAYLIQRAMSSSDISYLASPLTGGGVSVRRFPQLFLYAIKAGQRRPEEWAKFAWTILESTGQLISKGGKTLETEQENIAELIDQANTFAIKQLPILKALQIA
jgi:SAM-dependent methyltransferase